ncbi:MAG: immunoglobulin domain-containing protein, partial [Verrucomicrobiota bacterium]
MKKILCCCVLLAAAISSFGQSGGTNITITVQPQDQTVAVGGNVTFSVGVSGTAPFTYQWQFDGTNLANSVITTLAGNGTPTYSGDGGAASNAAVNTV